MSLFNSLRTSVSGMTAQTKKLDAIADNIANSSTVGYRRADVQFSSLLTDAQPTNYNSGGVTTRVRFSVSEAGVIQPTKSATDLAIQGSGFFYVQSSGGNPALTRAGSFLPDGNGDLRNVAGYYLMAFPITPGGSSGSTTNVNELTRVNLQQFQLTAVPTTEGKLAANLPSDATISAAPLPSANAAGSAYTAKSSLVTYDNLGHPITLDVYFTKTGANQWEAAVYNAADATNGGFPYASGALAVQTLAFDPANGALTGPSNLSLSVPGGQTMTLDLQGTTQLATNYQVLSIGANGNAPSSIDSVDITKDGLLSVIYKDGTRRDLYRIPLATVASPQNLMAMDGNVYTESAESGTVILGIPGSSNLGSLSSWSLESSNVDLGSELTSMIEAQREYTANSKVFKTSTEMLEVLMSVRS